MEEIIYFELDNWFSGRDYPNAKPFLGWMDDKNLQFLNDDWCKKNKLCVGANLIDMSICFRISAPRSWVETNCPKLLTNEECGSYTITTSWKDGKAVKTKKYEPSSYSKFVAKPNEKGEILGWLTKLPFREYCEENFGMIYEDDKFEEKYRYEEDE